MVALREIWRDGEAPNRLFGLLQGGVESRASLSGALAAWEREHAQSPPPGYGVALPDIDWLPPITRPGKLLCVGLNYPAPDGGAPGARPDFPVLFHKTATALTGHGQPIVLPAISRHVLYEGELAVVIGRRTKQVLPSEALNCIAGYTIANDVGAADIEARTSQWTSGKMFDSFCPLGPILVTADEIPDPSGLHIRTRLNGVTVQDAPTGEMIFGVPDLISYISSLTTLEPGDVILTGSPKRAGDAPDPRQPLRPGDHIAIEIEPIGVLANPVAAEENP
jgi:2-keto-4-pentenoate hydratase/2-oxohepta-3-ene-1,7-dioic acid hydratase in catechol pathway